MFIIKFFYLLQKINEAWSINKKAGDAEIASLFRLYAELRLVIKNRSTGELDKNCRNMVRETGLEPAHPKAYAPKAYVYTNFTTRA